MKDENDIIDIPTELEIEKPKPEVENLETLEIEEPVTVEIQNVPVENIPEQSNESLMIETPVQNSDLEQTQILEPVVEETQTPQIVTPEVPAVNNIPEVFPAIVDANQPKANDVQVSSPVVPEITSNMNQPVIPSPQIANNNELNAISLNNVEELPKVGSLDGNPDSLDIKVRGIDDKEPKKKKFNLKIIILILVAVIILAVSGVLYYNYLVDKKEKENSVKKEPALQIAELTTMYSFEEAYKKVSAKFDITSESKNLKYEIKEGKVGIVKGDQTFTASIKEINITSVSILKELDKKDIIGLKDDKNNFYFVEINHDIDKEIELDYKNNKLLTIPNDGTINNIAIADYLNNKGYFYLAEKEDGNFYIGEKDGSITTISEVHLNIYNGINIDFSDLNINKESRKNLKLDGIGLFYDGSLYMYQGEVENIKEKEIKDGENSLKCSKIYLTYREDLKYFDLYIITEENYLYQINLLEQAFDETKVNLIKKENLVKEHSMIENDGVYYLEITLDNDEKISIK